MVDGSVEVGVVSVVSVSVMVAKVRTLGPTD
jgi:hypothetical protein